MKVAERITVKAQSRGFRKKLTRLNIEGEDIKPLLGMDCLRDFLWTIRNFGSKTKKIHRSEEDGIFTKLEKLFKLYQTFKDTEIERQLNLGQLTIKQKNRTTPYYIQSYVEKRKRNKRNNPIQTLRENTKCRYSGTSDKDFEYT